MLTPSATRPRADAPAAVPQPSRTAAAPRAWVLVAAALAAGVALGAGAALADGHDGWVSDLLSMPGPWIAGAAVAALATARAERRWVAPLATAGFLLAGIAAYYVGKQSATGAAPGPLVVFWGAIALTVGVGVAAAVAWCVARPWGTAAVVGTIAGWLIAESLLFPSAPAGEAVVGALAVGLVGRGPEASPHHWRPSVAGALVGAVAATCVFAVVSRALSAAL